MSESALYLGLDIGTSGVKAVLVDADGELRFEASETCEVSHPAPLWAEQDPADWWRATVAATRALGQAGASLGEVRAVGLSGQMHGAVLLDEHDRVLRPAILWNDGRSHRECDELEALVPDLHERCGNLCMPGFTAPKLLWVARHEPDVFARVARVLLPKDSIGLRLTGEFATEYSDASGTVWLDPARRDWDDTVLAATGLGRRHMPTLHEGCDVVGELRAAAAESLGLPRVPVVAGGGDNAAGAVGAGVVDEGQGFLSLGTSGVVFVAADRHRPLPERTVHAFCHALPDRWHQMAVTLSAAESLRWFATVTGHDVADVIARVEAAPEADSEVLFLPYLAGERTPHNDPRAVGVFHGLTSRTTFEDMARAVMEGVAFSFRDGLEALAAAGARVDALALLGGGARSGYWRQLCADALGISLEHRASGVVGPAFGAARLARIGTDPAGPDAAIERVCTSPPVLTRHEPDTDRQQRLSEKWRRYRRLYDYTRPLHRDDTDAGETQ